MSPFERQVLSIIIHKPSMMIPLLKQLGNTKHVYSICNKWINRRFGLEFEVGDTSTFRSSIVPNYGIYKDFSEINYSSQGFKELIKLNVFLNELQMQLPFNTGSGIHIHIDFIGVDDYFNPSLFPQQVVDYIVNKFEYVGGYNHHSACYSKQAVRFHSSYRTIEYRIFRMTYTYSELVKWILCSHYMTRMISTGNSINTSIMDEIMAL